MKMLSEAESIIHSHGSPEASEEADSSMIREDLAEEWGCVIGYLECSSLIKDHLISEQFKIAAQDEYEHIIRLTRLLATLDPAQAEILQKNGLYWLTGFEHQTAIPAEISQEPLRSETVNNLQHGDRNSKRFFDLDETAMECLRNAIRDELAAVNAFQRQIRTADNPIVRNILFTIINHKKEHVAGFTSSLLNLLPKF